MKYRALGRTGLYVSELCLGTMTFAGQGDMWSKIGRVDQAAATALVERAIAAGVNFIDTADIYSQGEAEKYLGVALRDLAVPREDVIVATKVRGRVGAGANHIGLSRAHVLDSVAASVVRMGLDYVDLYQVHAADLLTPLDETMRVLDDLVRCGLVRYIGCSNMAAWQVMKAQGIAAARGLTRFESVQAYYTIATRDVEREIVPMMQDQGLGMMVWSPLAGGLLSGRFGRDLSPADSRRAVFDFPPVDREHAFQIVDVLRPIAERRGTSVARIALAWLLHRPAVMSVVIGVKTLEQLDDNLAASGLELEAEELAAIDRVSALKPEYPQWMIERFNSDPRAGVLR